MVVDKGKFSGRARVPLSASAAREKDAAKKHPSATHFSDMGTPPEQYRTSEANSEVPNKRIAARVQVAEDRAKAAAGMVKSGEVRSLEEAMPFVRYEIPWPELNDPGPSPTYKDPILGIKPRVIRKRAVAK